MNQTLENRDCFAKSLDRILSLYGTDEGFYVLSLFSWIESYANSFKPEISLYEHFQDKLEQLFEFHEGSGPIPKDKLMLQLKRGYRVANKVRHNFEALSKEEAISLTHDFLHFCTFVNWHDKKLKDFDALCSIWNEKSTPAERHQELIHYRILLRQQMRKTEELENQLLAFQSSEEELKIIREELKHKAKELEKQKELACSRKEKNAELRQKLHAIECAQKQVDREISQFKVKELYVNYLERFTYYTRSRAEYERSLMKLTPDQLQASKRIQESGDYLLKGSAGTGKTLVLLYALEAFISQQRESFDFGEAKECVLLTYTHTLVKFNSYLASIVAKSSSSLEISTIDHFFYQRLSTIDPDFTMNYRAISDFIAPLEMEFLSQKELEAEIETAIFGRNLQELEYINSPTARAGMKKALTKKQKRQVWDIAEQARLDMLAKKAFSKNFSRVVLLDAVEKDTELLGNSKVQRLFIDEVQDISPLEMKLLKRFSVSGLVIAGDEGQAIYQSGFSFKQLGISIIGHSFLLRTNYRNTRQIFTFAELYRELTSPQADFEKSLAPSSFREGPFPELWLESSESELMKALYERVLFFMHTLQYEAESIAILTPLQSYCTTLTQFLKKMDLPVADIRDASFDFTSTQGVRISTMHSAKGIEFPVGLLYIPTLAVSSRISNDTALISCRNLVYVAFTRCIDNLQVFTLKNPDQEVVQEIIEVFKLYSAEEAKEDLGGLKGE